MAATMESIEFSSLPGDKTEIRMKFDGAPPDPKGYTIESPARIALDLMDTKSALTTKYHSLGAGNAREVTVIEAKDRTRVIVNLTQLVPYETKVEGDTLFMYVGIGWRRASGSVAVEVWRCRRRQDRSGTVARLACLRCRLPPRRERRRPHRRNAVGSESAGRRQQRRRSRSRFRSATRSCPRICAAVSTSRTSRRRFRSSIRSRSVRTSRSRSRRKATTTISPIRPTRR